LVGFVGNSKVFIKVAITCTLEKLVFKDKQVSFDIKG
jgi:hypothetical protein